MSNVSSAELKEEVMDLKQEYLLAAEAYLQKSIQALGKLCVDRVCGNDIHRSDYKLLRDVMNTLMAERSRFARNTQGEAYING